MRSSKKNYLLYVLFVILSFSYPTHAQSEETSFIRSDSTWRASKSYHPKWYEADFDDSLWGLSKSPSNGLCSPTKIPKPHISDPMWVANPVNKGTAYFRKTFNLKDYPEQVLLETVFDDDGEIYINGVLIRKDASGSVNPNPFIDDITKHLELGENTIAIKAVDIVGVCQSLQVVVTIKITGKYILNVPLFKQNNDLWARTEYDHASSQKLTCGNTLENCGCATTSLAMLLSYYGVIKNPEGKETNPANLNEYFKKNELCGDKGCVSKGYVYGDVRWYSAGLYSMEANKKYGTQKIIFTGGDNYDEDVIRGEIDEKRPVIIKTPNNKKSHWAVAIGRDKNNIYTQDPFYDTNTLMDYPFNGSASKMRMFKKTNTDYSAIEIYAPSDQKITIKDERGNVTGVKPNGKTHEEIPNSQYFFEEKIEEPSIFEDGFVNNDYEKQGTHVVYIFTPLEQTYIIDSYSPENSTSIAVYATTIEGEDTYKLIETETKSVHVRVDYKSHNPSTIEKTNIETLCQ